MAQRLKEVDVVVIGVGMVGSIADPITISFPGTPD